MEAIDGRLGVTARDRRRGHRGVGGGGHRGSPGPRTEGVRQHSRRTELPDPRLRILPRRCFVRFLGTDRDAKLTTHGTFPAYVRALDVWGRAGKLDAVLPYAWASGTATVAGQPREREVSGFGDPRVRFSVLLHGAPALSSTALAGTRRTFSWAPAWR
jgi:hypothetical protein